MVQRKLAQGSQALGNVFERLSTGQRINRAADDAAGLAVAADLSSRATIFRRGSLNISDAVSMLSIKDGALEQVGVMLTRMQELAQQAANGSLGAGQRQSLDREFAALNDEILRITSSTKFNDRQLFAGAQSVSTPSTFSTGFSIGDTVTSSNGQFVLARDAANARIYDMESGTIKTFSFGANPENVILDDSGNVIFQEAGSAFFGDGRLRRYDFEAEELTTLTNEANPDTLKNFSISADGSTLAFTSSTNYTDGGTIDSASGTGGVRLYVMDLASGVIRTSGEEVTAGADIAISADGSKVALESSQIGGDSFAQTEIISASFSSNGISNFQRRTNSGAGDLVLHSINNNGELILESSRDLTGENAAGSSQFFRVTSDNSTTQLTQFDGNFTFNGTVVDARGSAIYLISRDDLIGENSAGRNQLFSIDLISGETKQLTNYSDTQVITSPVLASISGDGRFISTRGAAQELNYFNISPATENVDFEVGMGSLGGISATLESIRTSLSGLGTLIISSEDSARFALNVLGNNLDSLNTVRGRIGASLSRLSTAQSLLDSQSLEIEAAASRIRDADIASESAELVRIGIQQSAAAAVLAQANQQPALVLELLGTSGPQN